MNKLVTIVVVVVNLIVLGSGFPTRDLTAEFRDMDWKEVRDHVAKYIPTTTENPFQIALHNFVNYNIPSADQKPDNTKLHHIIPNFMLKYIAAVL